MTRCPYAVAVTVGGRRLLTRCRRRNVLGSAGWHLHDAPAPYVPGSLTTTNHVRFRWRSIAGPDHHVDHLPFRGFANTPICED